jgi:hypothetical protein
MQDWWKGLVVTFFNEAIQSWSCDIIGALIYVATKWRNSLMNAPTICNKDLLKNI